MKERILHILCRLIFIVAACPIDASALSSTDVTICNEYNEKSGIATETERDRLGRVTSQITRHNRRRLTEKEYIWGLNDQLLSITNNGKQTLFEYDGWGNLAKATYPDGKVELRNPDKTGNLFETVDRIDRKYSAGGRLEQSADWTYKYDDEGHLTEKRHRVQVQQAWKYHWNSAGMLEGVIRPDGSVVSFKYDALGRRIEKRLFNRKTRWVWDGNVPLHEWNEVYTKEYTEEKGEFYSMKPSKTTTWLFEEGTFVPCGKQVGEESFSIQSNYLGTPEVMYDADGKVVWGAELSSYGDVRNLTGERTDCPFRYQGQYEDKETGLYYNRFRYYSVEEGIYISQDPIRLHSGESNLFAYVRNTNIWVDILGLQGGQTSFIGDALHPGTVTPDNPGGVYTITATGSYQGDKAALYGEAKLKESFSPDYVAHHISYDPETNTMKMQLVRQDAHSPISHVGGVKDYREKHDGKGYESSKKKTKTSCKSK